MQTMQLLSPAPIEEHPLVPSELDIPEPGVGQLRLRVRACAVCHTDLHTVEGELELPKLPVVPGHQIVGVVDGLGRGVQHFHRGDRVGVGWLPLHAGLSNYVSCAEDDNALNSLGTNIQSHQVHSRCSLATPRQMSSPPGMCWN